MNHIQARKYLKKSEIQNLIVPASPSHSSSFLLWRHRFSPRAVHLPFSLEHIFIHFHWLSPHFSLHQHFIYIYIYIYILYTYTHIYVCTYIYIYRVSQEEGTKLRESVPYVKIYRYKSKHLYPKLNSYGDNGQRSSKLWQLLHTCWLPNTY
jgi:hypothetical protein